MFDAKNSGALAFSESERSCSRTFEVLPTCLLLKVNTPSISDTIANVAVECVSDRLLIFFYDLFCCISVRVYTEAIFESDGPSPFLKVISCSSFLFYFGVCEFGRSPVPFRELDL